MENHSIKYFDDISNQYKGKYFCNKKSWFNGHGYFPLYEHTVKYNVNNWSISIYFEERISEFSKKVSSYSNNYPCSSFYITDKKFTDFSISFNKSIFGKHSTKVKVKKNDNLYSFICTNKKFHELSNIVQNSSFFMPEFKGYYKKGKFIIIVNYNLKLRNVSLIKLVNDFVLEIILFLND